MLEPDAGRVDVRGRVASLLSIDAGTVEVAAPRGALKFKILDIKAA